MSEGLKLVITKIEDEMRSHGVPFDTIEYLMEELSEAITEQYL